MPESLLFDIIDDSAKNYNGDFNGKAKLRMTFSTLLVKISCVHKSLGVLIKKRVWGPHSDIMTSLCLDEGH